MTEEQILAIADKVGLPYTIGEPADGDMHLTWPDRVIAFAQALQAASAAPMVHYGPPAEVVPCGTHKGPPAPIVPLASAAPAQEPVAWLLPNGSITESKDLADTFDSSVALVPVAA